MEAEIKITELKIRKKFLYISFKNPNSSGILQINLVSRNPSHPATVPFHYDIRHPGNISASLDTSSFDFIEGDWDILVHLSDGTVVNTVLPGKLRMKLLLGNYQQILLYLLLPYIFYNNHNLKSLIALL